MGITRDDLNGFMENWDPEVRKMLGKRMDEGFRRARLAEFSEAEALVLKAALERLVPRAGEDERIDLVGFLDEAVGKPYGRGDRQTGMPEEKELFHKGIAGITETAMQMHGKRFEELPAERRDGVLKELQAGTAPGNTWKSIPSAHFFTKLLSKALVGYCSHPLAWLRMGFPGPSYPEGYVWVTHHTVPARRKHKPGWKTF